MRNQIITIVALLLLVSTVSAEISISQPKSIYTIGDDLSLSVAIKSSKSAEGFLKMNFVCNNESNNFYVSPFSINANEEKKVDTNVSLSKAFLGSLKGICNLWVQTPVGDTTSQSFEVTDRVDLTITPNKLGFSAGESASVRGTLAKANNKAFSGFAELTIDGTDIHVVKPIAGNDFQLNFSFPTNVRSGEYTLRIHVYEKDKNGEVTNQGLQETKISILKLSQKIEIAINAQSVTPGGNVSFKVFMYDQANDEVPGDVSITLRNQDNEVILQRLVKTDEQIDIPLEKNATPGYWKIEGSYQTLTVKRLFYVENQELASFDIIGDILYIRNIGNTPYKKAVQIAIGDNVEIKELDLDVGAVKKFRLVAPNGVYKVSVTDGKENLTLDRVSLTGDVIGVVSETSGNVFVRYPLVWIFIIIVFGMFILMMFERFADRKFIGYNMNERSPIEVKKQWSNEGLSVGGVRQAEHAVSVNGQKEDAAIIAFKIKNMHELTKDQLNNIELLFNDVQGRKGVVYKTGDYLIVILTPSITKSFKNSKDAVKIAKSIEQKLIDYNKKFAKKLHFGIGMNYGNLVVEPTRDRLRFASVGNSLSLAKHIADLSQGEILISKEANAKMDAEVKTEKIAKEGIDLYAIKKMTERGNYDNFIQGFLHRNK